MSEESFETTEFKEQLEEALEKAERAGEEKASPAWSLYLSLSTAVIAVLAAIAALASGSYSNQALLYKNEAVLLQAKASDRWAYYQAKGIKGIIYGVQAQAVSAGRAHNLEEVARYKSEGEILKTEATELEKQVQERSEQAEKALETHHQYALAVTLFQVAIALSAIAAVMRRQLLWWLGLGISAVGCLFFVRGLLMPH